MNFNIGNKVVCVDNSSLPEHRDMMPFVYGNEYTVLETSKTPCCGMQIIDVGVNRNNYSSGLMCASCIISYTGHHNYFIHSRFVKLDTINEAISELLRETAKV